jgi:hypothetical protein
MTQIVTGHTLRQRQREYRSVPPRWVGLRLDPRSRTAATRRVDAVAEAADIEDQAYPHSPRATAASYYAYHGVVPGAADRETLLPALERERESLQSVRNTLDDCERRGSALGANARRTTDSVRLDSIDNQLAEIEIDCESAAATRQQLLHGRSAAALSGIGGTSLVRYLYGDCLVTCPALADIVACLDTIRRHRRYCLASTC